MSTTQKNIVCDPQTSGGLLIAVEPDALHEVKAILEAHAMRAQAIGIMTAKSAFMVNVH